MIIKKIHIDGFGIYNDFEIDNFRKGLNIIIGKNEAGKTTLLRFLRYTLFGYPKLKEHRMVPLRGGAHGGKIMGVLSSGNEITVDRKGDRGFTLYMAGREYSNEGDLLELLGNASSSLYNNVYAFTLDELIGLESLTRSGVEDKIFSIGMGLGNLSLADIESDIRSQINDIYKSAGKNQQIPVILKNIGEIKSEIAFKQNLLPKRKELSEQLGRLERETAELENMSRENTSEKNKLENYLKCHDSVVRLMSINRELDQLPGIQDYPENGIQELELREEKITDLKERLEKLNEGGGSERGLPELKELACSLFINKELLAESGKVEYLKNNLTVYRNTLRDFDQDEIEVKKLDGRIKALLESINPAWCGESDILLKGTEIHKAAIRAFRQELEEIKRKKIAAEAHAEDLRYRKSNLKTANIAVIVSLVFIIISIPAFYYSLVILGGALALSGIVIFAGRKSIAVDYSGIETKKKIEDLEDRLLGITGKYRKYFADELGITGPVPPEAAEEVIAEIDKASDLIRQKQLIEVRQKEQREPLISEFESVARSLLPLVPEAGQADNIEVLVHRIIADFSSSHEKFILKSGYEDELKRKLSEAESIEKKITEAMAGIRSLLKTARASDPDEFRKKYRQNNYVKQLVADKNNAEQTIESIMGIGNSAGVLSYFRTNGKEQLVSEIKRLKTVVEDLNQSLSDRRSRIGEFRNEIKRVEEGSDMTATMTGLETARYDLGNAVRNWLAGRMALELLFEVRAQYEREKQPAVINNAARFFSAVTAGRYNRLHVSIGDRDVQVYDDKGIFKKTHQLSRGAREQLLLSLRLGFIEEYEKQSEPLPLIADEVLVNFDPHRARRMAEVIYEFSSDRQMLMFSCHPETIELFDRKNINIIEL